MVVVIVLQTHGWAKQYTRSVIQLIQVEAKSIASSEANSKSLFFFFFFSPEFPFKFLFCMDSNFLSFTRVSPELTFVLYHIYTKKCHIRVCHLW